MRHILRNGQDWSNCPNVNQNESEAWLNDNYAENATGGLAQAWIMNAFDPTTLLSGSTMLITLIFMVVFLVLAAVLLLFYISRLMLLALGAVMAPLICLLWLVPKMTHFAESAIKAYMVTVFSIFIHVIIIQLAAAFLTLPGQVGSNPFIAIFVGIALFSILLKTTGVLIQLTLASSATGVFKKFSGQLFNVLSPATAGASTAAAKPRRAK